MLTSLQVSQYLTGGLERARESLNEAAALRDRFVIGASVSRRVAAAAASAIEDKDHIKLLLLSCTGLILTCTRWYSSCTRCTGWYMSHMDLIQVDRLLSSEQKTTDYRSPDDGNAPDHRPTNACMRVVAYLSRVLESAFSALEGLNKQSFLTDLGNHLHKGLLSHWQKFTFSPRNPLLVQGGIRSLGVRMVISMTG
ncbi:hypothetical protein GW17_00000134 [Ensete ventricosum]|nr:hypothetical protein GW17_00000134 [Ensete ventricosum]